MQCYSSINVVTVDLQKPDPIACACLATVLHVCVCVCVVCACVRVCVCVEDIQQLDLAVTGDLYGVDQDRHEWHRIVQTRQSSGAHWLRKRFCGRVVAGSEDLEI